MRAQENNIFNPLNGIVLPFPQRTQLLEIPLINTGIGAKNPFPVINELRGVNIVAIESVSNDVLAYAPSGNQVITTGEMQLLTSTIFNSPKAGTSEAILDNFPLVPLATNLNGGVLRYLNPFPIDFQKSTINVNSSGLGLNKSAVFILYY